MDGWTGGVGNERVIYIGIIIWPLSEIHEEITRRPRDQEYASSFFFLYHPHHQFPERPSLLGLLRGTAREEIEQRNVRERGRGREEREES